MTCWNQREDMDKDACINGDLSPPRTRQRSRQETDHSSPLVRNSGIVIAEPSSKRQRMDEAFSPQITCSQEESGIISSQAYDREKRTEPVLNPTIAKGKRPEVVSPQTGTSEKRTGPVSLQASVRDKRTQPLSPQIPPREKRPVQERITNTIHFKEPKAEPGAHNLPNGAQPTDHRSNVLIKPKREPFTHDFPQDEVPIAVIHPQLPSTTMNEGVHLFICPVQSFISKPSAKFPNHPLYFVQGVMHFI